MKNNAQNKDPAFPPVESEKPAEERIEEKDKEELPEAARSPIGFWRRAARWLLGLLVVFGLGALLIILALYAPLRTQMGQRQVELQAANQKISDLEDRIRGFSALDTKNKDLQTQMQRSDLHIALLSARADVLSAQLALAKNDATQARVALNKTPETLEKLKNLLEPNQQKVADDMQDRLELALDEIETNTYAAQSDLDVLATSLTELENAFFARP